MKKILTLMILTGLFAISALSQTTVCTVADPTGTPLNVRSKPKTGKIVSKLKNGTVVRVEDYFDDADPMNTNGSGGWSKVSITIKGKRKILGWVLSSYLNCN